MRWLNFHGPLLALSGLAHLDWLNAPHFSSNQALTWGSARIVISDFASSPQPLSSALVIICRPLSDTETRWLWTKLRGRTFTLAGKQRDAFLLRLSKVCCWSRVGIMVPQLNQQHVRSTRTWSPERSRNNPCDLGVTAASWQNSLWELWAQSHWGRWCWRWESAGTLHSQQ